ncbi:MAG: hypothetical protein ACI86H_000506, partial [bacterium]
MKTVFFFLLTTFYTITSVYAFGPFPIKGEISDGNGQVVGEAQVYPRYVELFDRSQRKVGRVGVMIERGISRLFLVKENEELKLIGWANRGRIYNSKDKLIGSYFWTPTYSFVYDLNGKRAGKVKCIAWPRVCAAGV